MTCQFFIPSFQEETFSYNEEIHLKIAEYKTKAANVYIFKFSIQLLLNVLSEFTCKILSGISTIE